jgi:alkylation response protein AidB-like acyl-CoA dehydrogenase
VKLRVTRMLVYRAVWFADTGRPSTAPAEALASAAEALADISRLAMQACGSRSMTSELPLHRYYRLAAGEPVRYGRPGALWRLVGAATVAGCGADARQPAWG